MPRGIVRGTFATSEGLDGGTGSLSVRAGDGIVYTCEYDAHTYFERDHWPALISRFAAGDRVEVVSDRRPGSATCYVRMLRVMDPPARLVDPARVRAPQPPTIRVAEFLRQRGSLTYSGVVIRLEGATFTVRTRMGDETLLMRSDTRYLQEGVRVEPAALEVNTHVFVRGGQNLDGDLEAYQVVWGQILAVP